MTGQLAPVYHCQGCGGTGPTPRHRSWCSLVAAIGRHHAGVVIREVHLGRADTLAALIPVGRP